MNALLQIISSYLITIILLALAIFYYRNKFIRKVNNTRKTFVQEKCYLKPEDIEWMKPHLNLGNEDTINITYNEKTKVANIIINQPKMPEQLIDQVSQVREAQRILELKNKWLHNYKYSISWTERTNDESKIAKLIQEQQLLHQEFMTEFCRPATKEEYATWLTGFVNKEGKITSVKPKFIENFFYIATQKEIFIPQSLNTGLIIPNDVTSYHRDDFEVEIYRMDYKNNPGYVPYFEDLYEA